MNRSNMPALALPDRQAEKKIKALYLQYHSSAFIGMDPLITLQRFSRREDLELGALIASALSYGRVETIIKNIETVFNKIDYAPFDFITTSSFSTKNRVLKKFKHRFTTGEDLALFMQAVAAVIKKHGSIESFFAATLQGEPGAAIAAAMNAFSLAIKSEACSRHNPLPGYFTFLVPAPSSGSACKRMNMYLRWMIRPADGIDLGVWKSIPAAHLIMPVDTHIARIARSEGMTRRTSADWRMAEEITAWLRHIDNNDPVKFDFSLCRSGMVELRRSAA